MKRIIMNRYTVWLLLNAVLFSTIVFALGMDHSEREKPLASPTTVSIHADEGQDGGTSYSNEDEEGDDEASEGVSEDQSVNPDQPTQKESERDETENTNTVADGEDGGMDEGGDTGTSKPEPGLDENIISTTSTSTSVFANDSDQLVSQSILESESSVRELNSQLDLEIDLISVESPPDNLEAQVLQVIHDAEEARGIKFKEYPQFVFQMSTSFDTSTLSSSDNNNDKDLCRLLNVRSLDIAEDGSSNPDLSRECEYLVASRCHTRIENMIKDPDSLYADRILMLGIEDQIQCVAADLYNECHIFDFYRDENSLEDDVQYFARNIERCNDYTDDERDNCSELLSEDHYISYLYQECIAKIWFECPNFNYQEDGLIEENDESGELVYICSRLAKNSDIEIIELNCIGFATIEEDYHDASRSLETQGVDTPSCEYSGHLHSPFEALYEFILLDYTGETKAAGLFTQSEQSGSSTPDNAIVVFTDWGFDSHFEQVLFHEIIHALDHQEFPNLYTVTITEEENEQSTLDSIQSEDISDKQESETNFKEKIGDRLLAVRSIIEGNADYLAKKYRPVNSAFFDPFYNLNSLSWTAYDDLFTSEFNFPYEQGFRFVREILETNQVDTVDEILSNPPISTEQILDPTKYPLEVPLPVSSTKLESDIPIVQDDLGEFRLFNMLRQFINHAKAVVAARGWGGDNIQLFRHSDGISFIYDYIGDTVEDTEELEVALQVVIDSFDEEDGKFMQVTREEDRLLWVGTSDPDQVDELFALSP